MFTSFERSLRIAALAVAVGGFSAPPVLAFSETSMSTVNIDSTGVAIRGHDPVAYFTVGAPTPGVAEFTASHDGATYRFASAANREAFIKEPAKFAPQYGGFCAFAAAVNKKFDADPSVWKIVDGKLYMNFNADVSKKWNADVPGHIKKADVNWTSIKGKAPSELK
jgi:YHS domain-containing protein